MRTPPISTGSDPCGGRLGWLIENTLLYATGGVAFGGFDVSIFDAGTTTREAFSETYVGYTVGAGVETMFMPNLSGRIEYRFTDFGEENFDSTAAFPGFNFDFGFEVHAVRAALSWHF